MEYEIFEDCKRLIDNFTAAGDNSFPSFCEQWKNLQFQHIYAAQTTFIETMQTTAAVIHFARRELCCRKGNKDKSSYIIPDFINVNTTAQHYTDEEIRRRIGCLFLLYAIYFKQPTEHFMKIETNINTWHTINNFIKSLPMTQDMDSARYIFYRLLQEGAFRFTALNYCVGLEELVDYDHLDDKENTANFSKYGGKELGQQLEEFPATKRILPALSVLEDGYNEMKEMLVKTSTGGINKKSLPTTTIFKSIEQCFQNIQTILDDDSVGGKVKKLMGEESKKRSLKRKGFSNTTADDDANESGDTNVTVKNKSYKTLRRMSARTVFTDELPADLLEDLEEDASSTENLEDEEEELVGICESEEAMKIENTTSDLAESSLDGHPEPGEEQQTATEAMEEHKNELMELDPAEEFISLTDNDKNK